MSKLKTTSGDDYPDAAEKHLKDATALLDASRHDGAAYLSGYVVECSLKALRQLETGNTKATHGITGLTSEVNALVAAAGTKIARYVGPATKGIPSTPIATWQPGMRYRSEEIAPTDARTWVSLAAGVFQETIAQMKLDGAV